MSDADYLLVIYRTAMRERPKVMLADCTSLEDMDVIAHAVRFAQMSPAFKLRALVEEWSRTDIVREMY